MIYSILQLITALTLVNNPSSISSLSNEGNITLPIQGVYSSIDNIGDDLKIMYYYGDVQPLNNDFLEQEWKKGYNLNSTSIVQGVWDDSSPFDSYSSSTRCRNDDEIPVSPNTTYTLSNSGGLRVSVQEFQTLRNGTNFYDSGWNGSGSYTFTTRATTNYIRFNFSNSNNTNIVPTDVGNVTLNLGSSALPYQPYHSDSELFDVQYDEIAFSLDLEELDSGTSYQDYIDFWVSFNFASRVQYDGDEYTYSLRDLYFGFSRRDYDQPYPLFPTLNFYIYSSYNFSIDSLPANVRYTSSKIPLIYSSTDSYESLHHSIEGVVNFSSYDVLEFSLCFEYIDPTLMSYMVGGVYDLDYREGFNNGKDVGYQNGVEDGKHIGYDVGYDAGKEDGRQIGIAEGREQVIETGQTASVIFNGIISVGLLPTNVFLQMLNLEVFGINIGALVSSLLTIMIIIIIGRMLFGGKNEV